MIVEIVRLFQLFPFILVVDLLGFMATVGPIIEYLWIVSAMLPKSASPPELDWAPSL